MAWVFTASFGVMMLTQLLGWTGWNLVYVLQALTLVMAAPGAVIAVVSAGTGRYPLATVNAVLIIGVLVLAAPVVFHGDPPEPGDAAPRVAVLFANTYYENPSTDRAAAMVLAGDADVIGLVEFTPQMAAALDRAGINQRYPNRVGGTSFTRDGVVLFSRYRVLSSEHVTVGNAPGIDAVLDVDGAPLRVLVIHPLTAMSQTDVSSWRQDLATIGDVLVDTGEPTIVIGDFNATRWHPAFREILGGDVHDVHEWLGHGFSTSWPSDGWMPPFVRIDHALVTAGATPVAIRDVETPGSDHRSFVVTIAVKP